MSTSTTAPERDIARIVLTVLGIGLLIAGSLTVLWPFLGALLWATMIVVSTWPLMIGLQRRLAGKRGAAVAVMTVALLLVLFAPLYTAVATLLEQSGRIAELARELPTAQLPSPPGWVESIPVLGSKLSERWAEWSGLPPEELAGRMAPYLKTGLAWFAAKAGSFGGTIVQFLLTVLISAILYVKGEAAAAGLRRFFRRLSGERGDQIVVLAGQAVRAVAFGIVVTALVQAAIAGLGFAVARVPFAGLLTAVVLLLCIAQLGPLLGMLPAVIWLYATGNPGRGTTLLVAMILAQVIDNVLRPLLIKRGADLSLLLIFAGVVGGLLSFGIIGLFVGPVILAVTSTLLDSWVATGLAGSEPAAAGASAPGGPGAPPSP